MTRASAPASAANLGPGFDVLALALDLRLAVEAEPAGEWEIVGERDERTAGVLESLGLDPMRVTIESDVPVGRGLGSSAALRTAVAAAALTVDGEVDRDALFDRVAAAEGHADNAAAAVFGGLMAVSPGGVPLRLAVHPSLLVVVGVPPYPIPTGPAREVLPDDVSRADAVAAAGRLAFLIDGLRTADAAVLGAATGDDVHERARASLSPATRELIEAALAAGALHAAWSGAGPAAIAFVAEEDADAVMEAMRSVLGGEGEVLEPEIDRLGVVIES